MNTVTQYIAENRRQLVLAGGVAMVAAFGLLGEGVEQLGAVFILWGASTPFLYTWDGNRYVMDNDVWKAD